MHTSSFQFIELAHIQSRVIFKNIVIPAISNVRFQWEVLLVFWRNLARCFFMNFYDEIMCFGKPKDYKILKCINLNWSRTQTSIGE